MSFIYLITNQINNKCYVGKTKLSLEDRFSAHCRDSLKEHINSRPLYRAMNKYGVSNFTISLLEEVLDVNASEREIYWIKHKGTFKYGYNATTGGDGTTYIDRSIVISKYAELKSIIDVALELGYDRGTVSKILDEYNIPKLSVKEVITNKFGRSVAMCERSGGIIRIFNTIKEAADFLGKPNSRGGIIKVCQGQRTIAYGYKWVYIDDLPQEVLLEYNDF